MTGKLRRHVKTKQRSLIKHPAFHKPRGLCPFFPPTHYLLMRTWGHCNCCRKGCTDQRCNFRENEVLSDDFISLVCQAEPSRLFWFVFLDQQHHICGMCICVYVKHTTLPPQQLVKMSSGEELRWLDHLHKVQHRADKIYLLIKVTSWEALIGVFD